MPRKEKPLPRRPKPVFDTPTYLTAELCARYHISRRTLRRWSVEQEYPEGRKRGRHVVYVKVAVHDWERKHMPELHAEPEKTEDDKRWDRLRLRHQLDKLDREAEEKNPPASRPKRTPRRAASI